MINKEKFMKEVDLIKSIKLEHIESKSSSDTTVSDLEEQKSYHELKARMLGSAIERVKPKVFY